MRTKLLSITFLEIFPSNGMSSTPHVRIMADAALCVIRGSPKMAFLVASYFEILEDLKRSVALACSFVACELPDMFESPIERENIDDKGFVCIVVF